MNWESIWTSVMNWVTNTGIKIVVALIILWIAFKIINALARKIEKKNLASGKLDKTLARMIISAVKTLLKVMVVLALVGWLGIDTSGFHLVMGLHDIGIEDLPRTCKEISGR